MTTVAEPLLRRPRQVIGPRLRFRDALPDDAAFILGLRLDPGKNAYLSETKADLAAQTEWLQKYQGDPEQVYFVITDERGQAVGTVRIYDLRGRSFSWGSWILAQGAPPSSAVESTLMVYAFGLACGFDASHFEVRRGNEKVWQYHERFGAVRTGEDALNFYYSIDRAAIEAAMRRYQSRVPDGVQIVWE